jgi:AcrR family transcriptional regulator
MKRATTARGYHSPLREEQSERTRAAILDALGEQLTEEGLEDFSMPKVARRANVAVRTIYRYFPTREALLDALSEWLDQRVGGFKYPETLEDLFGMIDGLFRGFDANAPLIRSQLSSAKGRALRARAAQRRARGVQRMLQPLTAGLDPADARRAGAIVHALFSAGTLFHLTEVWGFDAGAAAEASRWAIGLVLDELKRHPRKRSDA